MPRRGIEDLLQARSGTYALVFECLQPRRIAVGRLGTLELTPGFYLYVGSAFGPGGVRARVGRHLKPVRRRRWHIDYFKPHCRPVELWIDYAPLRRERAWAEAISASGRAGVPMPGFGASDAPCITHLFFFDSPPATSLLGRRTYPKVVAIHDRVRGGR